MGKLFVVYVIVEIAAFVLAVTAIGFFWTFFAVLAGSILGLLLVRSQGRRVLSGLRQAADGDRSAGVAVTDGLLVGIGAVLMVVPGLVTTVVGLLLLLPPTRMVIRPLALLLGARRVSRFVAAAESGYLKFGGGVVIDGDVVVDRTPRPRPQGPLVIEP